MDRQIAAIAALEDTCYQHRIKLLQDRHAAVLNCGSLVASGHSSNAACATSKGPCFLLSLWGCRWRSKYCTRCKNYMVTINRRQRAES